jgi:hypothetical protein
MPVPGVHIQTLQSPSLYDWRQIEAACAVAQLMNRGKFVLVEAPKR